MNNPVKTAPWACPYPADQSAKETSWDRRKAPASHLVRGLKLALTAGLLAGALYGLSSAAAGGELLLSAFAGTSALVYFALLLESPTLPRQLVYLAAPPAIFAAAYLSLNGSTTLLALAFVLHTAAAASQLPTHDHTRVGMLWFWLTFNAVLAVLVI